MDQKELRNKEVLNVEEAALLLSLSPWTVRVLAKAGKLPGRKLGKEWRFSRQALLEYLRSGQGEASGD